MVKRFIYVKTDYPMLHQYKKAPDEVSFLKYLHRHIFKFKICIEVGEQDRDIEFFIFKNYIDVLIVDMDETLGDGRSCEQMSNFLYKKITNEYPKREIRIDVSEDGENGSYVEYS